MGQGDCHVYFVYRRLVTDRGEIECGTPAGQETRIVRIHGAWEQVCRQYCPMTGVGGFLRFVWETPRAAR